MKLGADFRWLWWASGVSEAGSAVGFGALPLVAVLVLQVGAFQVSLLAALAGIAAAAVAVPAGPWIEFRRKRPIMIGADLGRAVVLVSVPVAMVVHGLTFAQLCLVAIAETVGTIVFAAAAGSHLKALTPHWDAATGRLEATSWTVGTVGPGLGGALTSTIGVAWTIAVDAVSFVLSAAAVRRIRTPEAPPPPRQGRRQIAAGWRYLRGHRGLRPLFANALMFGGGLVAAGPLLTVLMLGDLRFAPWQYGLAFGLPSLGGVLGALAMRPLAGRYGRRRVLLTAGVGRAMWLIPLAATPPGGKGLVLVIGAQSLALFGSGVFNPAFAAYRMAATDDTHLARVITAWSIGSRTAQPLGIVAGGAVAAVAGVRVALLCCGAVVLLSAALLPWRRDQAEPSSSRTLASSSAWEIGST